MEFSIPGPFWDYILHHGFSVRIICHFIRTCGVYDARRPKRTDIIGFGTLKCVLVKYFEMLNT